MSGRSTSLQQKSFCPNRGGDRGGNGTSGIWAQSWPGYKRKYGARVRRQTQRSSVRSERGAVSKPTELDQNRTGGELPVSGGKGNGGQHQFRRRVVGCVTQSGIADIIPLIVLVLIRINLNYIYC